MTSEYRHTPVLLAECLEYSNLKPQHTFVDATLGGAGHSFEAAKLIGSGGTLIGIDQDEVALAAARPKLGTLPDDVARAWNSCAATSEIWMKRSSARRCPASMRFCSTSECLRCRSTRRLEASPSRRTALLICGWIRVNKPLPQQRSSTPTPQQISLGSSVPTRTRSGPAVSRISRCARGQNAPIETSEQLVDIIKAAIPASARRAGGHPAKRTFQALRIEVNGELDVLRSGLDAAIRWLNPGGRLVVISYHSLEDRIVKETFAQVREPMHLPVRTCRCACAGSSRYSTSSPGSRFCRRPKKSSATLAHAAPSCASRRNDEARPSR